MTDQDKILHSKDDGWFQERMNEIVVHAANYSVSPDEVQMLFASTAGSMEIQTVFQVIVVDQHGKLYPVGISRQGDRIWKEDGMSRVQAVSPRYKLEDLKRILADRTSGLSTPA